MTDAKTASATQPAADSATSPGSIAKPRRPLRLLGGVDISFVAEEPSRAFAALIVLEYPSLKVRALHACSAEHTCVHAAVCCGHVS